MTKCVACSSYAIGIILSLFVVAGTCGPCLASPTTEDPAPEQPAGEGAEEGAPAAEAAPEEASTREPTVDPKAAEEACKKTVAGLRSGDFSALEALPENERNALLSGPTGVNVLTCLAIAEGNKSRCDSLSEDSKKACLEQWKLGTELKGVPKEKVKAQLIYRTCTSNSPDMNCDVLRKAIGAGDATRCKELKEASRRDFCAAVATGDAKKCDTLPQGAERAYCAAFAADDASRCPKEAPDCIAMARGFAALKKGGLEAFQDIDATIAAAAMGTKACGALLGDLESSCNRDESE
jgi:hypothetical protein